jgi:hypothetical protein
MRKTGLYLAILAYGPARKSSSLGLFQTAMTISMNRFLLPAAQYEPG